MLKLAFNIGCRFLGDAKFQQLLFWTELIINIVRISFSIYIHSISFVCSSDLRSFGFCFPNRISLADLLLWQIGRPSKVNQTSRSFGKETQVSDEENKGGFKSFKQTNSSHPASSLLSFIIIISGVVVVVNIKIWNIDFFLKWHISHTNGKKERIERSRWW